MRKRQPHYRVGWGQPSRGREHLCKSLEAGKGSPKSRDRKKASVARPLSSLIFMITVKSNSEIFFLCLMYHFNFLESNLLFNFNNDLPSEVVLNSLIECVCSLEKPFKSQCFKSIIYHSSGWKGLMHLPKCPVYCQEILYTLRQSGLVFVAIWYL